MIARGAALHHGIFLRRHRSSRPRKHSPKRRVRSSRTRSRRTRATCSSSSGGVTSEGNNFNCRLSPCALKTSMVFSQRDYADPFNSPRQHRVLCRGPEAVRIVSTSDQYVCGLPSFNRWWERRNMLPASCHVHAQNQEGRSALHRLFRTPTPSDNDLADEPPQKWPCDAIS